MRRFGRTWKRSTGFTSRAWKRTKKLAANIRWAQSFPLRELERRGYVSHTGDAAGQVRQLLKFFGAGTVEACRNQFTDALAVAYRHSPSFESNEECLLSWLRTGEIKADQIKCADFDRAALIEALREIRLLTTSRSRSFYQKFNSDAPRLASLS